MNTELKKIVKRLINIDNTYETAEALRRVRLLKTAQSLYKKYNKRMTEKFPLLSSSNITKAQDNFITWMQQRYIERTGRVVQKYPGRTQRRINLRHLEV